MQVMIQHVQAEPRRPSLRIERPIPPALEALVLDCLEKEPARPAADVLLSHEGHELASARGCGRGADYGS
jgi:hypothetical protein